MRIYRKMKNEKQQLTETETGMNSDCQWKENFFFVTLCIKNILPWTWTWTQIQHFHTDTPMVN